MLDKPYGVTALSSLAACSVSLRVASCTLPVTLVVAKGIDLLAV